MKNETLPAAETLPFQFWLFIVGSFISFVGTYMQVVGVAWHVYQLTHSAFYLGILGLVGFFPVLLTFLPSGVIVDKLHKKYVLLFSEFFLGILTLTLFFIARENIANVWLIFTLIFTCSLITSLETPARVATTTLIVPPRAIPQAASVNTLPRQLGSVVGPALAGFAIAWFGVQSIYLFNALSFFIFFFLILFLTIPKVTAQVSVSREAIMEGLHFITKHSLIGITMLLDFLATFFAGAMVLLPVFARDIYHVNVEELGLLYAAPAVGAIGVGFYLSSKKNLPHQGKMLIIAIAVYALATIGFGLSKEFFLGLLFLVIIGAGDMVSTVIRSILRQTLTPAFLQGRVLSTVMIFYLGGPYLGDAEAGFVAGFLGAPLSVVGGGVVTLLLALGVAWKVPELRNYENNGA